jgi:hypothetical protein
MKKRLFASLTSLALVAIVGASSVAAGVTVSETIAGNPPCEGGTKIDPVVDGTYDLVGGGTITIDVYDGANGQEFNFDTEGALVSSILVKGGPNAILWSFDPPVTSWDGLHAPENLKNPNGYWYGLSHLCVLSDKKDDDESTK